ncbi:hypothetical protein JQN64_26635, partial [Escherichia coli]|nr:hypothetical protein [Escherichia coli]
MVVAGRSLLATVALGTNVFPAVSLLHVLFAVGFTLGGICARRVKTLVLSRGSRVLVVHVSVTFLLGRPAEFKVLAVLLRTLPRAGMCLLVLGQITWALEFLVAVTAGVANIAWLLRFASSCHGASHLIVVHVINMGVR